MVKIQAFMFIISFILTYILVPINIRFSLKHNLVDNPSERSVHTKSVPLAGGLSFGIVIILVELVLSFLLKDSFYKFIALAVSGMVIILFGLYDDKKISSPIQKLLVQLILILILYYAGFKITKITNPFGRQEFVLGIFSLPITIIWFLVLINAINLVDGLDGLAAGISFFTALVLVILGNIKGFMNLALISASLAGCMIAFLRYNFYPAKIFMGDTGSLFLGMNLAAISIIGIGEFKRFTAMTLLIPISALIVPISDFIITILRRLKNKSNIMKADDKHLHHILLKLGLSQKTIASISYLITFVFGIIAIGFSFAPKNVHFIVLLILFVIIFVAYFIIYKENKE